MPVDPITAAIVGSIVGSVVQDIANLPPPGEPVPVEGVPRTLPSNTLRGDMKVLGLTSASINGEVKVLAPGVQIRDPFNTVVLPLQISSIVPVRYQTDVSGAVFRVWILSQREAAQP